MLGGAAVLCVTDAAGKWALQGAPLMEMNFFRGVVAVAILVPVKSLPGRVVRVNVTFAESVLRQIDAHAEASGLTRSGFLALAATKAIAGP